MKDYCYIKTENGLVEPICLRHEDGHTVHYSKALGKINFDGCKIGDTVRMFDKDKLDSIVTLTNIKTVKGIRTIVYEPAKDIELPSEFLLNLLSNNRAVISVEVIALRDQIEEYESYIKQMNTTLVDLLNQNSDIDLYANQNNLTLLKIEEEFEEED